MTPAARLAAAIEALADIEARRRPAADALKDWGLAHRFAGSSDRAAIAGLVYDALRRKASAAFVMGFVSPRLKPTRVPAPLPLSPPPAPPPPPALGPPAPPRLDTASLDGAPP